MEASGVLTRIADWLGALVAPRRSERELYDAIRSGSCALVHQLELDAAQHLNLLGIRAEIVAGQGRTELAVDISRLARRIDTAHDRRVTIWHITAEPRSFLVYVGGGSLRGVLELAHSTAEPPAPDLHACLSQLLAVTRSIAEQGRADVVARALDNLEYLARITRDLSANADAIRNYCRDLVDIDVVFAGPCAHLNALLPA